MEFKQVLLSLYWKLLKYLKINYHVDVCYSGGGFINKKVGFKLWLHSFWKLSAHCDILKKLELFTDYLNNNVSYAAIRPSCWQWTGTIFFVHVTSIFVVCIWEVFLSFIACFHCTGTWVHVFYYHVQIWTVFYHNLGFCLHHISR